MPRKTEQIDLNSATIDELSKVSMIGRERARRLVDYREENGPFEDWSDLLDVEGFNEKLVDDIEQSGNFFIGSEEEEEWEEEEG
jgi:competence protein ComEA